MTISSTIRRRTAIASAVAALGLAGFAAATPAHAQSLSAPDSSAQVAITATGAPDATATPAGSGFSCPTSQLQISSDVSAVVVGVGCLNWGQGSNEEVQFSENVPGIGVYMSEELTLQGDGNFVFYNFSNNITWASHTRLADNKNGPGTSATFQSDGNLVVRNLAGTAIWASNSHTYKQAILAFQSDGNLVIYQSKTVLTALWATNTR